jgi:hypothetical protein
VGAVASLLGGFRSLRLKVTALEDAVGRVEPAKSGIFLSVFVLEDVLKKLRREIDSWEDQPPRWAERLFSRARGGSSNDLTAQLQFEERINVTLRSYNDRFTRFQEDMEASINRWEQNCPADDLLTKDEYLKDSRVRAEEMIRIREQIATANGLLKGVMSAVGLLDPDRPKPPRPGR